MTTADDYAAEFMVDLRIADGDDARQQQTHNRVLGVSDIAGCREYARRFLSGEEFTDTPEGSQARAGKAFHALVLPAIQSQRPTSLIEQELTVTLANGVDVLGHADLIEPDEPSVTDLKTVDTDLAAIRRTGASGQQKYQRHLYAAGAIQAGLVPEEGLVVRNIWLDRSGTPTPPHVEQEPYDPSYLDGATRWLDEVLWHVDEGTEAPKDRDWFFCQAFCPFFTACRGGSDGGTVEEIVAPDLAVAAALYQEGSDMEKEGKALKDAAKVTLARLDGQRTTIVGEKGERFKFASTWVNPSDVAYTRSGYHRLSVKEAS